MQRKATYGRLSLFVLCVIITISYHSVWLSVLALIHAFNNHEMKNVTALYLCALFLSIWSGACGKDNPVTPGPPDAPLGMPNWNDTAYTWARDFDGLCGKYYSIGSYWAPKFYFRVMDASSDGRQILVGSPGKLLVYDTATHMVRSVLPFYCTDADWSRDGRYIAAIKGGMRPKSEQIVIYDVEADDWWYLPLPDTIGFINLYLQWMPLDTALLISPNFPGMDDYATIGVQHPHAIIPFDVRSLGVVFSESEAFSIVNEYSDPNTSKAERVDLRVGAVGDTVNWRLYPMPGIFRSVGPNRLSTSGDWLAFGFDADVHGTLLSTGGVATDYLPCIGVIDLRSGSATQYKLYRVFADYTETYRNCSALWRDVGVAFSGDGKYLYHEWVRRSDSTMQIVRREIRTGRVEEMTNFLAAP